MGASRILEKVGLFGGRRARRKRGRGGASPGPGRGSVGRYLLREAIGRGAVGEVWRAVDPQIDRPVAVKILNLPGGVAGREKAEWEQRFVREARAAGRLSHPGIVTIHDVGMTEDGRPFIVMELVEGLSLDAVIRDGPAPSAQTALEWGAQIAEALGAAHRLGIVHRDVKPANVLIDRDGRVRIADFGIARLSRSDLTHDGLFLGSPAFASPEQIRGTAVDGRSDLFSLGATLYLMLTGVRPFGGEDLSSLAYAICHVEPAPLRRFTPGLARECEAVVMIALAKDPERRHPTAQHLADDLRAARAAQARTEAAAGRSAGTAGGRRGRAAGAGGTGAGSLGRPRDPRRAARAAAPANTGAMVIAVAMALGLATVGGYLLTLPGGERSRGMESGRVQAGTAASLAGSAARSAVGEGGARRGARPSGAAAPRSPESLAWAEGDGGAEAAIMSVEVAHALPDGLVTIWSGKRRLLHARLGAPAGGAGAAGTKALPSDPGAAAWPIRLPAGEHLLRVRVASSETGLDVEEELSRTVQEKERFRLYVRVKSVPSPKLEFVWTDN